MKGLPMRLIIHPRVHRKHQKLSDDDVRAAFRNIFKHIYRSDGDLVCVGIDGKNRLVELIARYVDDETVIVYHAFTPPTHKVMRELGMIR